MSAEKEHSDKRAGSEDTQNDDNDGDDEREKEDEEEEDDGDNIEKMTVEDLRRRRVARMLENQQRYIDMCTASASVLQMLSRLVPGVIDDIQVEDVVSDDSSSSSSSEHSSPSPSVPDIIWTEPVLRCQVFETHEEIQTFPTTRLHENPFPRWRRTSASLRTSALSNTEAPQNTTDLVPPNNNRIRASPRTPLSFLRNFHRRENDRNQHDDAGNSLNSSDEIGDGDKATDDCLKLNTNTFEDDSKDKIDNSTTHDYASSATQTTLTTDHCKMKYPETLSLPAERNDEHPISHTQHSVLPPNSSSHSHQLSDNAKESVLTSPIADLCAETRKDIQRAKLEMSRAEDSIRQAQETLTNFKTFCQEHGLGQGVKTCDTITESESTKVTVDSDRDKNVQTSNTVNSVSSSQQHIHGSTLTRNHDRYNLCHTRPCPSLNNTDTVQRVSTISNSPAQKRNPQRMVLMWSSHNQHERDIYQRCQEWRRRNGSLASGVAKLCAYKQVPSLDNVGKHLQSVGIGSVSDEPIPVEDNTVSLRHRLLVGVNSSSNNKNGNVDKAYIMPDLDIPVSSSTAASGTERLKQRHIITSDDLKRALEAVCLSDYKADSVPQPVLDPRPYSNTEIVDAVANQGSVETKCASINARTTALSQKGASPIPINLTNNRFETGEDIKRERMFSALHDVQVVDATLTPILREIPLTQRTNFSSETLASKNESQIIVVKPATSKDQVNEFQSGSGESSVDKKVNSSTMSNDLLKDDASQTDSGGNLCQDHERERCTRQNQKAPCGQKPGNNGDKLKTNLTTQRTDLFSPRVNNMTCVMEVHEYGENKDHQIVKMDRQFGKETTNYIRVTKEDNSDKGSDQITDGAHGTATLSDIDTLASESDSIHIEKNETAGLAHGGSGIKSNTDNPGEGSELNPNVIDNVNRMNWKYPALRPSKAVLQDATDLVQKRIQTSSNKAFLPNERRPPPPSPISGEPSKADDDITDVIFIGDDNLPPTSCVHKEPKDSFVKKHTDSPSELRVDLPQGGDAVPPVELHRTRSGDLARRFRNMLRGCIPPRKQQ